MADLRGFMGAELAPPRFVVDTLVPSGTVTLLGAHGGSGKSLLALTIAAHVAAGSPWAGFDVAGGPAAFVSLEDPAELMLYRLRKIVTEYRLQADDVTKNLRILDGTAGESSLGAEYSAQGVRRMMATTRFEELRDAARGARLIVVDNASDAADVNENDRRMVRAFVRLLAGLARENDAGVLLLAHIDKSAARNGAAGNSYAGSTAWHNSSRSRLALIETDGRIEMRQEKLNVGRAAEPIALRWSTQGVLMPASGPGAPVEAVADADADGVLEALREAIWQGVKVPTARTGPATAHRVLETTEALPGHLRGQAGKDRFWRALARLQREGFASSEEYRNADSKVRTRLVVVEQPPILPRANPPIPPYELAAAEPASPQVPANPRTGGEPAETGGANWEGEA
ncbi:MAG: AAA family ATPase [Xanthomonadales bacterium]|nr:AAA family ATPase [Xanthomonadales bacterium]